MSIIGSNQLKVPHSRRHFSSSLFLLQKLLELEPSNLWLMNIHVSFKRYVLPA